MLGLSEAERETLLTLFAQRATAPLADRDNFALPENLRLSLPAQLWWAVYALLQDEPLYFLCGATAAATYSGYVIIKLLIALAAAL
jgi:hypothetical protein